MLKPLGDKLIVKVEKSTQESTSKGGIVLNTSSDPEKNLNTTFGTVIKIGPQVQEVDEGNDIYFEKHGAHSVTEDGIEYKILSVKNILCIKE